MKKIKAPSRQRFPEDERRLPWLSMLLDAYSVIDKGIAFAIQEEETIRKRTLACKKGCDTCCRTQNDIPIYPLEALGIQWYVVKKISEPRRSVLRDRLLSPGNGKVCPFLVDGCCSVHPLRPIGCRQFNVFTRPCEEGEDPYYTRRDDVLMPIRNYTDKAFSIMLPFYGITDEKTKTEVIRNGLIHTKARVLQSLNWSELAKRMEDVDSRMP